MVCYTTSGERTDVTHEDIQNALAERLRVKGHIWIAMKSRIESTHTSWCGTTPVVETEYANYSRLMPNSLPSGNKMSRIDVRYESPWNDLAFEVKTHRDDLYSSLERQVGDYRAAGHTAVLVAPTRVYRQIDRCWHSLADINIEVELQNGGIDGFSTRTEDVPTVLEWI